MYTSSRDVQKLLAAIALEDEVRKIPIVVAISNNNLAEVKKLLDEGTNVNFQIPNSGKTPLHIAVGLGHDQIVSYLISAGANVNIGTNSNFTPLHVAAQQGKSHLIELLISANANVNALTDVGTTPLHEAASKGHKEAVTKLIQMNADLNMKDKRYNLTAANLAQENGFVEVRDILVDKMTYRTQFIQNINYILFNWKRNYPESTAEFKFLYQLSISIRGMENSDELFLKLRDALKSSEYQTLKNSLAAAHKLFIANMKKYNEAKLEEIKLYDELPELVPIHP